MSNEFEQAADPALPPLAGSDRLCWEDLRKLFRGLDTNPFRKMARDHGLELGENCYIIVSPKIFKQFPNLEVWRSITEGLKKSDAVDGALLVDLKNFQNGKLAIS